MGGYRDPNLGSSMYHVSVSRSVADTHNSNKIDIKNHTFIANGESMVHGSGCIAWATGLISYITVSGSMLMWLHSYKQLGVRT